MALKEATISHHYYWNNIRDDILTQTKFCRTFWINNKKGLKYGHIPAKEAEAIPWNRLSVDIIGPYKIRREGRDQLIILKPLAKIYLATGWFEIMKYKDKQGATIENLVEKKWLCRYPNPTIIAYDHGN